MSIENFLLQRYPGSGRQQKVREEIANACNAFVKSGLSDAEFIKELCSGSEKNIGPAYRRLCLRHVCVMWVSTLRPRTVAAQTFC